MEDPILTLARDLSGNDLEIIDRVRQFVDTPPTRIRDIGFYGGPKADARVRIYFAAVTALADYEHLYRIEDKYTPEIIDRWIADGVIQLDALPPTAKAVFSAMSTTGTYDDEQLHTLWQRLFEDFAEATRELEHNLAERGKALVSVDATDGDTMFFALVEPAVAAKWLDKALVEHNGYRAGVRRVMWDRFWFHLSYALRFDDVVDSHAAKALPPGTHERINAIPFVESR